MAGHQGAGGRVAIQHPIEFADLDGALAGVGAFHINAQAGFFNHPDVPRQGGSGVELNGVAVHRFAIVGGGQDQTADRHGFVAARIVGLFDFVGRPVDDGAVAHAGVEAIAEIAHRQHVVVHLANARQHIVGRAQSGGVIRVVDLGHGAREGGGHHGCQCIHQTIAGAL